MADEIIGESTRLPPFPDDLVQQRDPERVIAWLRERRVPPILARRHLHRWSAYTGAALTIDHYRAAERDFTRDD